MWSNEEGCGIEYPEIICFPEAANYSVEDNNEYLLQNEAAEISATALYSSELEEIKTFKEPSIVEIEERKLTLGLRHKKFTLVLDLDNTLIYCDVVKNTHNKAVRCDLVIELRPFVLEFLKEMSQFYEIVVFTAADQKYAETVVDVLDPERKYIKEIAAQDRCVRVKGRYLVKDLRIFADRSISQLIIVDDNVLSFAFQQCNGIPVKPFNGQEKDDELVYLMDYLKELYLEEDLPKANFEKLWKC